MKEIQQLLQSYNFKSFDCKEGFGRSQNRKQEFAYHFEISFVKCT